MKDEHEFMSLKDLTDPAKIPRRKSSNQSSDDLSGI
jgi:hypothetical protein